MKFGPRYFYDLPVYRLGEGEYYAKAKEYTEAVAFPSGTLHGEHFRRAQRNDPAEHSLMVGQTLESYGGCWTFNEIIGYIRLHFLGTQVRGEYFAPNKKRLVRTRTRQLYFRTWKLAPEVEIELPICSESIRAAIDQYIKDCRRELPTRHIDVSVFNAINRHVDWFALFRE